MCRLQWIVTDCHAVDAAITFCPRCTIGGSRRAHVAFGCAGRSRLLLVLMQPAPAWAYPQDNRSVKWSIVPLDVPGAVDRCWCRAASRAATATVVALAAEKGHVGHSTLIPAPRAARVVWPLLLPDAVLPLPLLDGVMPCSRHTN